MVRLSAPKYARTHIGPVPEVTVTSPLDTDHTPDDVAAPWSWTAAEASTTEASLLPFLIHLAVARDDIEGVLFCIRFQDAERAGHIHSVEAQQPQQQLSLNNSSDAKMSFLRDIGAACGIVNFVDPASGHAPLHVAALNGSVRSLQILLESGALVHLRDKLGHTALYYVGFPYRLSPPTSLRVSI